jgi:hypothetical protein
LYLAYFMYMIYITITGWGGIICRNSNH